MLVVPWSSMLDPRGSASWREDWCNELLVLGKSLSGGFQTPKYWKMKSRIFKLLKGHDAEEKYPVTLADVDGGAPPPTPPVAAYRELYCTFHHPPSTPCTYLEVTKMDLELASITYTSPPILSLRSLYLHPQSIIEPCPRDGHDRRNGSCDFPDLCHLHCRGGECHYTRV